MGLLRFIMATAVVAMHTAPLYPFHVLPAMKAVQTFYIISGFYMALILSEKYHSYGLYITNRILRIYPVYFVIVILSIIFYLNVPGLHETDNPLTALKTCFHQKEWLLLSTIILATLFIIGRDVLTFLKGAPAVLVPPAWTLSLEFMFYLLAPFLVRLRNNHLIMIFFISLVIRIVLYMHGFKYDQWAYRFFPSELALFILGIFSFRIYRSMGNQRPPILLTIAAFTVIYSMVFLFPVVSWPPPFYKNILYFFFVSLGLPVVFASTRNNRFDRWIGDFSYPIYLSHVLVASFLMSCHMTKKSDPWMGWWVLVVSFLLSCGLLYFIIYPIDQMKEQRILNHKL